MNLVKHLLIISSAALLIKIVLNAILVNEYQQNGLAISTSVSYIFMSMSGYFLLRKKLSYYKTEQAAGIYPHGDENI